MRRLVLSFGFFIFAVSSFAQTTGFPPFGSFDEGHFDAVNVGNLNANFSIPIVSTHGRGTGFNYSVVYDTLIWQNTGTWTPVTDASASPTWGWKTTSPLGQILFNEVTIKVYVRCGRDSAGYKVTTRDSNYSYTDSAGTNSYAFPGVFYEDVYDPCTDTDTITYQYTGYASDESGAFIDINSRRVWSKSGLLLNNNAEDTNGNFVSAVAVSGTETDWKDSAGLTAVRVIQNGSNTEYHYYDATGADRLFMLKRQLYSIKTAFGCSGVADYNTGGTLPQVSLPYEFDLPDGSHYSFSYESTPGSSGFYTGRLTQITLPTGGSIQYAYTASNDGINCSDGTVVNLSRTFNDGTNSATWSYVRNVSALTTTVTTPKLPDTPNANDTVYTFNSSGREASRKIYANSPGSGTPLRTVNTTWATNGTPATQVTILEDGSTQSETDTTFDSNGILDSVTEYDYGSGAHGGLIRTTSFSYQTASAYTSRNMLDLITQKKITDASGVARYQQSINYDESGYVNSSCPAGAPQHDDTGYPCSFTTRGLPTSITTYANASAGTGALTQHVSYDWFGNAISVTDPANNTTSISYADNYSDSVNRNTNAFPTTITRPNTGVAHVSRVSYFYNFGLPYQTTDENSQVSTFSYDFMRRPASATDPTNAVTNFSYQPNATYCCPPMVASQLSFNNGNSLVSHFQYEDGLGRPFVDQRLPTPNSSNLETVTYAYDASGRLYSVSMPCLIYWANRCPTSTPTSTQTYDALNRPLQTIDGGGGSVTNYYTQNDVFITVSPAPSGESAKRRQLEYDALGRLTSVCEITGATGSSACGQKNSQNGFLTKYTYDALGNLLNVTQNAQPGGSLQTRSFGYDSMSRLTSEANPESGTTTYTYDSDSTCGASSGDLVKKVDNAGNVTCTNFDALHRPTTIYYPSGPNASVSTRKMFYYDTSHFSATSNTKGRLASAGTCFNPTCAGPWITAEDFSYSARGEITEVYESTPNSGGSYHITQGYWPNGLSSPLWNNIASLPVFTFAPDGEGRVSAVNAVNGSTVPLVTATQYNSASLPTGVTYATGDSDSFTYDPYTNRMTQYKFTVGSTPQSVVGNLTWNANGTLQSQNITDAFNSADTQNCSYGYDDLTRIASANCGSAAAQTFIYDPFGNINKSGSPYSFQPTYSSATNRMTSLGTFTPTYDADGNNTADRLHTYAWDADGRPVTIDSVNLTYDALGRMVEQNRSGTYTQIVYAPSGRKFALMNGQTLKEGFAPLPGGAIAAYTTSGLLYYGHPDYLGSIRFASRPSRTLYFDTAYAPFGETYASSYGTDPAFTGQRQDTVSGDYDFLAREYSIYGRWPSPDPAGLAAVDPTNPQSWNRYAYVLNNPTDLVDPLGLDAVPCTTSLGPGLCGTSSGPTPPSPLTLLLWNCSFLATGAFGWPVCLPPGRMVLGDFAKQPRDRDRVLSRLHFELFPGLKGPGQTFRQCIEQNKNNYTAGGAVATLVGADQKAVDIASSVPAAGNMFLDAVFEGPQLAEGLTAFVAGMGSPLTWGRRTSDIAALNLAGKGGLPQALSASGKGARSLLGTLDKALSLGLTLAERAVIDATFVAGEAIACSH